MREKKSPITAKKESGGVADGFDFSADLDDFANEGQESTQTFLPKKKDRAEIELERNYSPYYTPKPKKGARGGTLGRGAIDEEDRKVQFSLTCTKAQKEKFKQAAVKDKRRLPDFICLAVEEYIEKHKL